MRITVRFSDHHVDSPVEGGMPFVTDARTRVFEGVKWRHNGEIVVISEEDGGAAIFVVSVHALIYLEVEREGRGNVIDGTAASHAD